MILTPKQTKALDFLEDDKTHDLIFGGGAGGGKSALGCYYILKNCHKYPGSRWLIGRSVLKVLKETTLVTLFEVAKMQGLQANNHYTYNAQSSSIQVGKSTILLKDLATYPSDKDFDNLGSLEITGAFIDECNQVSAKAKNIVKSRIRYKLNKYCHHCGDQHKNVIIEIDPITSIPLKWTCKNGHTTMGLRPKLLGTCNPSKNWVYSEFYIPHSKDLLNEKKQFIQALAKDNPHISPFYIENLKTMDANSQERLLYGNWSYDSDPATLIDYDSIQDYFENEHIKAEGKMYITADIARLGKDKMVIRVWHGWKVIKRVEVPKCLITEAAELIKQLSIDFSIPRSHIIVDEDGVGGGVKDILKCKGFVNNSTAVASTSNVDKKLKENYDNLKSQCSFRIAKRITAKQIYEPCGDSDVRQIISEEMEQVKAKNVDKDSKLGVIPKDIMKEKLGRSPDDWDSIMMREYFELRKFGRTSAA